MSKKNTELEIIDGKQPILLSAPHVFAHRRPSLSCLYKQGEPWTDYIVKQICERSNSYGIYAVSETNYDPNYYKIHKNNYKKKVKKLIVEKKIKYFFDIHGLSDEYEYDFGIYYLNRYNKSKDLTYDLANALNKGGLRNCLPQILNLNMGKAESLTEFTASKLKVPSLQIEVSRYIREDKVLRDSLVENFSKFLTTLY